MEGRFSSFFHVFKLCNTMFEKGSVEVCKINDNLCHFSSQLFDNNCTGNYALAVYSFFSMNSCEQTAGYQKISGGFFSFIPTFYIAILIDYRKNSSAIIEGFGPMLAVHIQDIGLATSS